MSTFLLSQDWRYVQIFHTSDVLHPCWCRRHLLTIAYPLSGKVTMEIHRTFDSGPDGDIWSREFFQLIKRASSREKP